MMHLIVRACALAILGFGLVAAAWSQEGYGGTPPQGQPGAQQAPGQPDASAAPAVPAVTKEELDAYNKFVADARTADARQTVIFGEAFVGLYPNSMFAGAVHSALASAYLGVNQVDKMIDSGEKALAANPNNVDVLPLMAWAIPRRVNASTPNAV